MCSGVNVRVCSGFNVRVSSGVNVRVCPLVLMIAGVPTHASSGVNVRVCSGINVRVCSGVNVRVHASHCATGGLDFPKGTQTAIGSVIILMGPLLLSRDF